MTRPRFIALIASLFVLLSVCLLWWRTSESSPYPVSTVPESSLPPPAAVVAGGGEQTVAGSPRPLLVARESAAHAWTSEDARDPAVIRRLAHNAWEERRLLEENERVIARQLVYRKEPVFVAVDRARAAGKPLRTFVLPGMDGQELAVEVTGADIAPSGLTGTLTGRLAGAPESLVTIAFSQASEAFTVISPTDGLHLQGHPRDPGELFVTRFDPERYLALPGGEPILTNEPLPRAE